VVPAGWAAEVRERGLHGTPPPTMSDLPDGGELTAPQPWQPGGETPLDRAIAATRRAVYPLHGLDPDDPRD
jgi:acetoin utilization protein AcuC